jgi:hypothetical protein
MKRKLDKRLVGVTYFKTVCSVCGGEVIRERKREPTYCSDACKQRAYRERFLGPSPEPQGHFPAAKISEKKLERFPVWEIAPDIFVHDTEPGCGPHPEGYPIKR